MSWGVFIDRGMMYYCLQHSQGNKASQNNFYWDINDSVCSESNPLLGTPLNINQQDVRFSVDEASATRVSFIETGGLVNTTSSGFIGPHDLR